MTNILSIDLESWIYFDADASGKSLAGVPSEERRRLDGGYFPRATREVLDLLDGAGQKATFFVVGESYDWYPEAIDEIRDRGHEVGYHTHTHRRVASAGVLAEELEASRTFLERFQPIGFRAPRIDLPRNALPQLRDWGFRYSSSSYEQHQIEVVGGVHEIPVSTLAYRQQDRPREFPKTLTPGLLTSMLPFGSGLFVGLLGRGTSWFIRHQEALGHPAVIFLHPWQIIQPQRFRSKRFKLRLLATNPTFFPYALAARETLKRLLRAHEFTTFRDHFGEQLT